MPNETTTASLNELFADIFEGSGLVARAQTVMPNLAVTFTDRTGIEDRVGSERGQIVAAAVAETSPIPLTEYDKAEIARLTPGEVAAAALITDRAARTDLNLAADLARELGGALAEKIDSDLCSTFADFDNDEVGDGTDEMSIEHIEVAAARLRDGKKYGQLVCVMHERQWYSIRNSLKINQDAQNAPEFIREELARQWFMGQLGGVGLVVTPHVPVVEGVATAGLFVAGAAVAYDVRQAPAFETDRRPLERATSYQIVSDYGYGTWRADHGVPIVTSAGLPSLGGGGAPGTGD
jgi:hypothetical protein